MKKSYATNKRKKMTASLLYCSNEFETVHKKIQKNQAIFKAFEGLAVEIKKLDYMTQLHLYSVTTQLLASLVSNEGDVINPLDVFVQRSNDVVRAQNGAVKKVALALGVIAIALSVVVVGVSLGFGVGILLGLWQTPLLFMAAFMAAKPATLLIGSVSSVAGTAVGALATFLFFKKPKITKALDNCVEEIKKSYLSKKPDSANEEHIDPKESGFDAEPEADASFPFASGLG